MNSCSNCGERNPARARLCLRAPGILSPLGVPPLLDDLRGEETAISS